MVLRIVVVLVLAIVMCRGAAEARTDAAPARLVVKYRPSVDACVHCLVAGGVSFASVTGRSSLDRLQRELAVRAARALFLEHHTLREGRAAAWAARAAAGRSAFALRTARAAGKAVPDLSRIYVLDLPENADVAAAASRYASDPDVEWVEPD
ncbi:MAG: S8 family serine peptidase, partial [Candidatus Binatia bacterium]